MPQLPRFLLQTFIALLLIAFLPITGQLFAQDKGKDLTVKVSHKKRTYIGKPMAWDGSEMLLLRRDGRVSTLPVKSEKDFSKLKEGFYPYSSVELKSRLRKEFGSGYQVSATQNFVVVHPKGAYNVWAHPFQQLYSRFQWYFSSRGFQLEKPEFPMVAVVLKSRHDFDRFLRRYHEYNANILGYYSPKSNRIITYDQTGGKGQKGDDWFFNASTIIHEATHQTAFNTGIHSRYAPVPRWVSEGLAMMFESPGINNSGSNPSLSSRINRERLLALKYYYKKKKVKGKVSELVTRDDMFRSDPQLAYALSWGLSFYLNEKLAARYHGFLRADAKRKDFRAYSSKQRAKAFSKSFGLNFQQLEAQMERYFKELKVPKKRTK